MSLCIRRLVALCNHQTHTAFVLFLYRFTHFSFQQLVELDKFIDNIYFQIAFIRSHICKAAELHRRRLSEARGLSPHIFSVPDSARPINEFPGR